MFLSRNILKRIHKSELSIGWTIAKSLTKWAVWIGSVFRIPNKVGFEEISPAVRTTNLSDWGWSNRNFSECPHNLGLFKDRIPIKYKKY